jgi:hypothetical protein
MGFINYFCGLIDIIYRYEGKGNPANGQGPHGHRGA